LIDFLLNIENKDISKNLALHRGGLITSIYFEYWYIRSVVALLPSSPVLWIRIRIDLAVVDLDPDPYWECGYRSMEIDKNLVNKNLFFCLSKQKGVCTFVVMYFDLLPI
jgi:hypothetical protein